MLISLNSLSILTLLLISTSSLSASNNTGFIEPPFEKTIPIKEYNTLTTVEGILIEGSDYSGKSVLASNLEKFFINKNNIVTNHSYLSQNRLVYFLTEEANLNEDLKRASYLQTSAIYIDQSFFKAEPNAFYIQDRYWLSRYCRNKLVFGTEEFKENDKLKFNHLKFKYQICMTAEAQIMHSRAATRAKKNYFNTFLQKNDLFDKYNKIFLSSLPADEEWLIIDSSHLSPEEVLQKVINYFKF